MEPAELIRVLVVHNPVGSDDDPSTSDVLAQVELVEAALQEMEIPSSRLAVPPDRLAEALRTALRPGTQVFNLIESPPGEPHVHSDCARTLELSGVRFTGASAAALAFTTDKIATRSFLAANGLPVAPGGRLDPDDPDGPDGPEILDRVQPPWILKPAFEDASLGLEGDPLCSTREAALEKAADLLRRFPGKPVLLEKYLSGRELNVSLLAHPEDAGGVEVLPVAEILFQDFPAEMPRIVGYEAKWDERSFAYTHTVRHFPEGPEDAGLLQQVKEIARAVWRLCGLTGYARVDFRLDETGAPHVLEVNANPCLSADAGFVAAAAKAGLSPRDVVQRILAAAEARDGQPVRRGLLATDREPLESLIRATGFFNAEEIDVALELIDDALTLGESSHYRFLVSEAAGEVDGYACWGSIPGTLASADLYWIVVHPGRQGQGIGAQLLQAAEHWMTAAGRTRVYIETSTRAQYDGTRRFYLARGYHLAAELPDFYAPGDGKAVFLKVLP